MAITSDFTGMVPAGTPHHSGFQNPGTTYLGSPSFGAFTTTGLVVTALTFFYAGRDILDTLLKPHTPPWELLPHPDQFLFPESDGRGMWIGPGVRFYVS